MIGIVGNGFVGMQSIKTFEIKQNVRSMMLTRIDL